MPEKDIGVLSQGIAAIVAVATIIAAFVKSINLSKDVRDFKNEVRDVMKAHNAKIEEFEDTLADSKADNLALFPTKKALDTRLKSQEDISAERHMQLVKAHEELVTQNKEIFKILTDMRSEEIRELKAKVRELEK